MQPPKLAQITNLLTTLHCSGVRSVSVRGLLYAINGDYVPTTLAQLNTLIQQIDAEMPATLPVESKQRKAAPAPQADRPTRPPQPQANQPKPQPPAPANGPSVMDIEDLGAVTCLCAMADDKLKRRPLLIGIELNPGPAGGAKPKAKVTVRVRRKAAMPKRRAARKAAPASSVRGDLVAAAKSAVQGNTGAAIAHGLDAVGDAVFGRWAQKPKPSFTPPAKPAQAPTAPLVGVEPNPGPPKRNQRRKLQTAVARGRKAASGRPRRAKPMMGGLGKPRSVPVAVGATRMRRQAMRIIRTTNDSITLGGRDFITSATMSNTNSIGDVLYYTDIHPDMFISDTRLGIISSCYERFLFHPANGQAGCTFHIESAAPSSTAGSLATCIDLDPGDNAVALTGAGSAAKTFAIAHNGHIFRSWENSAIRLPATHQQKDYWVDDSSSDPRLTRQGRFYLIASELPASTVSFDIWMSYEITLRVAQLDTTESSLSSASYTFASGANTAGTAANPFYAGTLTQWSTSINLPHGLGIAYAASNNFFYQKPGYTPLRSFSLVLSQTATVATWGGTTWANTNGTNVYDQHSSVGTNQTTGVTTALVYVNSTSIIQQSGITGAMYWNGTQWVTDTVIATVLPVQWIMSLTVTTLTTPTSFILHLLPFTLGASLSAHQQRRLRRFGLDPADFPAQCCKPPPGLDRSLIAPWHCKPARIEEKRPVKGLGLCPSEQDAEDEWEDPPSPTPSSRLRPRPPMTERKANSLK
jgi:hypothetical protein